MFSPSTPFAKTPQSVGKNRRTFVPSLSSPFLSPSAKRTFSPSSAKSRNQSLNKSAFQASVLEETAQHTVLSYGSSLSILVTEAITERISDVSVKLEESGWACLVCGRRLFIWKFKPDVTTRNIVTNCRELTLPPSELAHKAELVHVSVTHESRMPSVLAVSPEGIVRYWPNIIHEGLSAEASTDMSGQECYLLTSVQPLGCIVATTTCSLVLITPTASDGQHNVICRTLKFPQSVLAGIGRRVSSFIFGGLPSQTSETKQLIKVLSSEGCTNDERILYVLSNCSLQKWRLAEEEPDELMFERDLDRSLKENFLKSVWSSSDATQLHQVKNWCLDMQLTQNGVAILTSAMNPSCSQIVYYAFAFFSISNDSADLSLFRVMKHSEKYQADLEEKLLNYKFLLPTKSSQIVYLYNSDKVFCFPIADNNGEHDVIDTCTFGSILGGGTCDGLPLFFTQFQGLLSLQHNQSAFLNSSVQITPPPKEIIVREQPIGEPADSFLSKLRSAMCLYFNHELDKCQDIITEAFPPSTLSKTNSELDTAVILLSIQIIDDYPVSDPRWCESIPTGDSVSSSLIILHQLDDKLKAHDYLINFLKALGLFDRLSTVKRDESKVSTKVLLCEHAEKLIMAKVIRRFVVDYNEILDPVIKETLSARKVELKNHLTHQDMFFREVSQIHTIFQALIDWEERMLSDEAQEVINLISTINSIFVGVITSVLQYRQSKASSYDLPETDASVQFLPWTSSEGPGGMRTLLMQQHSINVQYMLKATDDVQVQGVVFQQIVDIIDFLLDGYSSQLLSIKGSDHFTAVEEKYKKERNRLIRPLLEVGQFERAASLAEKYMDFDILVQVCEDTNTQERLQRYMLQFKEQGFSDFMFKWYLDRGMRNKLLEQPLGQQEELSRFLQSHDDLSWLHHVNNSQYGLAQQTLRELALKESRYLSKKKTLLSLSKLTALASDLPSDVKNNQVEALNLEQDLIIHQENLPDTVVEAYGLDPDTARVLSPEELIEMYISDENTAANAFDFKIALELLQFVKKPPGDDEYESLRTHIWCKAILRDNWEELDTSNPLEAVKDTVFFQVIELAYDQGVDLHNFVIPVDDLLQSPELQNLTDSCTFTFLIRAGYEYIYKLLE